MLIRREAADDVPVVRRVVAAAFRDPSGPDEPVEVGLLDRLRDCDDWIPQLSLVGELDGEVVGHVVCSRAWVEEAAVVGLGPLAVHPVAQRREVGTALMHAVLGAAEALEVPAVGLLGSPDFYGRFGFRAGNDVGVEAPDPTWGRYFQVRTLVTGGAPRGRFRYAEPFSGL